MKATIVKKDQMKLLRKLMTKQLPVLKKGELKTLRSLVDIEIPGLRIVYVKIEAVSFRSGISNLSRVVRFDYVISPEV